MDYVGYVVQFNCIHHYMYVGLSFQQLAWCLYCDVICLNYDGNMHDAALIALMAALQNVQLPEVTYDEESERTTIAPDTTLPLKLKVLQPRMM